MCYLFKSLISYLYIVGMRGFCGSLRLRSQMSSLRQVTRLILAYLSILSRGIITCYGTSDKNVIGGS